MASHHHHQIYGCNYLLPIRFTIPSFHHQNQLYAHHHHPFLHFFFSSLIRLILLSILYLSRCTVARLLWLTIYHGLSRLLGAISPCTVTIHDILCHHYRQLSRDSPSPSTSPSQSWHNKLSLTNKSIKITLSQL